MAIKQYPPNLVCGLRWAEKAIVGTMPLWKAFGGTLKNELVHHRQHLARHEAKQEITEYTDVFYLCPVGITGNANKRGRDFCPRSHLPSNISSN
jgi:hypothetical protein